MGDEERVRCNRCMWEGTEETLGLFPDGMEWFKGCPHCKTDKYLMDIEARKGGEGK